MSGLQRYCIRHGDWVDQAQAVIVDAAEVGSGPSLPVYACHDCTTGRASFVGRRDAAPVPPQTGVAPAPIPGGHTSKETP